MALGRNRRKLADCFLLCTVLLVWYGCVYVPVVTGTSYVSDLSVRKLITGTTANGEIWGDVDKYCCVGFRVKLDTVCSNVQWFSSEFNPFRTADPFWGQTSQISSSLSPKRDCGSKGVKSNQVVVFDTTVLWMNAIW